MPTWTNAFITTNGLRLHYTRTGGDKPPVVLVHGFTDDGLCWTPVAKALAPDYDVIMPDARGHGRSFGPEEGYGSLEQATDLAGLINELGLHRPAVLGHSMGAASALALAGLYPEVPAAILLEDPPVRWVETPTDDGGEAHAWRKQMLARVVDLKRKTAAEMIEVQRSESPNWSEEELVPWTDSKLRFSFFAALSRAGDAALDWPTTLRRITCPVLLITADPDRGSLVKPADATALQALTQQTRTVHIAEAGHSIRREQFAAYIDAVTAFLAETI